MTKKDYIKIAEQFAATHQEMTSITVSALQVWEILRDGMAVILADDNPRFNYGRFFVACRSNPEPKNGGRA